jgi:LysR family transcriptional regulator, glycine cleavage system transcriptional activator
MTLVDLNSGKTDLAIRYGSGIIRIFASSAFSARRSWPVCSRALRDSLPSNAGPADLKGHSLLHDDSVDNDPSCPTWPMWLRAAGVQRVDAGRGPRFSQSSLVLEAAALGQGFALAKATLAADDLAAVRLVRLFEISVPIAFAYYLVHAERVSRLPRVLAFREWIYEQVHRA